MQRNSITITLPITKKGELQFFQMLIPKDVDRIVGMEVGISGCSGLDPNWPPDRYEVGVLKVQAEQVSNLCFSTEIGMGAGLLEGFTPGFTCALHPPNSGKGMHPVLIRNSYTLYGCYEDTLAKRFGTEMNYTITLVVWTERDEPGDSSNGQVTVQ